VAPFGRTRRIVIAIQSGSPNLSVIYIAGASVIRKDPRLAAVATQRSNFPPWAATGSSVGRLRPPLTSSSGTQTPHMNRSGMEEKCALLDASAANSTSKTAKLPPKVRRRILRTRALTALMLKADNAAASAIAVTRRLICGQGARARNNE
jgi:hypothetical protein